ncbi:MAG: alpha-1,2-fucosyltransferase, partial [Pedobacter sp.]
SLSAFPNIKCSSAGKLLKYIVKNAILPQSKYIYQSEKNEWVNFEDFKFSFAYLEGYFQSENYFKKIRQQLLLDFQFSHLSVNNQKFIAHIQSQVNSVSIHVRRGDYLKPYVEAFHGLLNLEYYRTAIKEIEKRINNPHYYIFSDDPEWCRNNFSFLSASHTIVSNQTSKDWEDMCLMSNCKHNIIANSSYSWWAAWLNKNQDKLVIAPQKWFTDTTIKIVPKEWITL